MARSRETKIELTAYDDLFQTDESREEAKLSKIRDIPISEIDEFPDHPFKVLMDEDMEQLVESIKRNGVMTPATVRLKEDGRYELISGHRRKKACELAGLETLKCEVKELTRDEAIIVMVESNLQRSVILPSEKAFAYKMLKSFTDKFKEKYGVECVAALHHNKRMTNFHIHLIFSERQLLAEPVIKTATRNMFYDEHGNRVRTKKGILDENGNIRKRCKVIKKGEIYERNLFTSKNTRFKREDFLDEIKLFYT